MSESPTDDLAASSSQGHAQQPVASFTKEDVLALWRCAEHNSTLSNETLDAMRDALLSSINEPYKAGPDPSLQPNFGKSVRL